MFQESFAFYFNACAQGGGGMRFSKDGINFDVGIHYNGNYGDCLQRAAKSLGLKAGENIFIKSDDQPRIIKVVLGDFKPVRKRARK